MRDQRLVIVSNRIPSPATAAATSNLSALIKTAAEESGDVLWFGWSGRASDDPNTVVSLWRNPTATFVGADLTTSQMEGHLKGFSNCTLWPLLHEFPERVLPQPNDLELYQAINERFARQLAPMLRPGDRIWIQDYHLIPLGLMLRRAGAKLPLGFFLHTPFPAPRGLLTQPWYRKLAEDFAAYDLVGLQSAQDRTNFRDFMQLSGHGTVDGITRRPVTGVFPVGIHTRSIMELAASADMEHRARRFARCLRDRAVIVGADRLDYTKGLIERFRAYELLLHDAPQWRRKSCLVQVTAPSRPLVPGYLELRLEQQTLGQEINERLAEVGWMPIFDIYADLPRRSLAALFRLSKACLATPLRDGGSLLAKEYVAAQNPADPGALILSRYSGATDILSEALIVDPYDTGEIARALDVALNMPVGERQDRWRRMIVKLLHHDAVQWNHRFLCALSRAHQIFAGIAGNSAVILRPGIPARRTARRNSLKLAQAARFRVSRPSMATRRPSPQPGI